MKRFMYNESDIKTVYLMMGFNCNFKCRHCIQSDCRNPEANVSEATLEYIRHLIAVRPERCGKLRLMFWGGEPLLYMDIIRSVVEKFGDRLDYSIVTNGSLLTQENVAYLNENKIHVALSYDGRNTKAVRLKDVTEDNDWLELFNSLESRAVCAVISAYNYDLAALFRDVDDKFGRETPLTVELLKVTWDMPEDLYNIDLGKYRDLLHGVAEKALADLLHGDYTREIAFFYPYLRRIIGKKDKPLACGQGYSVMNVDLSGNIYPCPNELLSEDGERVTCKINKVIYDEVFWIAGQVENSFSALDLEV